MWISLYNVWSHPVVCGGDRRNSKGEGVGSLCCTETVTAFAYCILYERKRMRKRQTGVSEHTQRANMTQEMLAKAQTGWNTETDRDKSL